MMDKFQGIITALITPFNSDKKIDFKSYENLLEQQVKAKVSGVVACGTTSENPTLNREEKYELIKKAVEICGKNISVLAGTGCNSTQKTIEYFQNVQKIGVDGVLIVTPYYNRPNQEGIYQHFKAINDSLDIPIMIYTVPKRTNVDFTDETIMRLAELKNIISIKDSGDDILRVARLKSKVKENFTFLTGDDPKIISYCANGGHGCVSVASNLIPQKMLEIYKLIASDSITKASEINNSLLEFYSAIFSDVNPIVVKHAAVLLSLIKNDELRLPLIRANEESAKKVKFALQKMGLINNL